MPPAARIVDPTTHGAPLAPGPGSVNVLIGGMPAWRAMIDQHACPAVSITGADGMGMVMIGSMTVLINTQMACRMGDIVVEIPGLAMGPANPILMGCPTVLIGEMGPPAPPGLGGASLSSAMCAAHTVPMPGATPAPAGATPLSDGSSALSAGASPQASALQEAADEGTPLVEKCPYAHDA